MNDLLIAASVILMLIGPPILTAIQRANSGDMYLSIDDLYLSVSEQPE